MSGIPHMLRRASFLCLATGFALALVSTLTAGGSRKPTVRVTKGEVESIGMDGPVVAYDVRAKAGGCNRLHVWNLNTNRSSVVSGKRTCEADSTSTGGGVGTIAVAGHRLAWIVNVGGLSESDDSLLTSSFPRPKERQLASALRTGDIDGTLNGRWIGGLVGDRDLLAVSIWTTKGSTVSKGSLRRIGGGGLKTIAQGPGAIVASSASAGRIAVLRADGSVGLYSRAGVPLQTIAGGATDAALDGSRLVTLTTTGLAVYDTASGDLLHTWKIPKRAELLDAASGIAVFTVACKSGLCPGRVYVTRLADGKTVQLAHARHELVGLEIEPTGVAYASDFGKAIVLYRLQQVKAALG